MRTASNSHFGGGDVEEEGRERAKKDQKLRGWKTENVLRPLWEGFDSARGAPPGGGCARIGVFLGGVRNVGGQIPVRNRISDRIRNLPLSAYL